MSDQELVNYLNTKQHFFKAQVPTMSYEKFKSRLMDLKFMKKPEGIVTAKEIVMNENLPESFDAREKWPQCVSIKTIRHQAQCGSCWAVSAASVMSDRLCIATYGQDQRIISDTDILSCCGEMCGDGCQGGIPIGAYQYGMTNGVCTGGPYNAKNCCKPYPFPPNSLDKQTPICRAQCQFGYNVDYYSDKIYANSAYSVAANEDAIRKEIFTNGPVTAAFYVYSDFNYYKNGVYVHTWGESEGGHAIRLIGWGVENGVKYWLASNSWGADWGDGGYFKIRRGTDECNIETFMVDAVIMNA
ncbi:unnamed protein product [Cylicocyclus nassatus]|nr:unnamed protein product [Cylicocyclus nassatus]